MLRTLTANIHRDEELAVLVRFVLKENKVYKDTTHVALL